MKGKNLTIQLLPLSLERVDDYLRWFNDAEVSKYLLPSTPKTKTNILNWLKNTIADNNSCYFSIFLTQEKLFVGHIGLKKINWKIGEAKIGIVIGEKKFWRKGIGTKAVLELLDYAKFLKLKRLFAEINKSNIASLKFFTRLGFKTMKTNKDGLEIFVYQFQPL